MNCRLLIHSALKYTLIFISATFSVFLIASLSPGSGETGLFNGYFAWLWRIVNLDAGESAVAGERAATYLSCKLGRTMTLALGATAVSLFASSCAVLLMVKKKGTWPYRAIMALLYAVTTTPAFLLCYLFILFFVRLDPSFLPDSDKFTGWYYLASVLVLGLGNNSLGDFVRGIGAETEKVLSEPYIAAAKARGVSVLKHSIRPILLATVNMVSSRFILTIGCGVVVVEYIFNIHGIGLYILDAARNNSRDIVLLLTGIIIGIVCLSYLASDVVRLVLDRRDVYE